MKRLLFAVCAVALLMLPPAAFAQSMGADSPKATVSVQNPLVIGNVTLTPGSYRFQCLMLDGKTYLVVTSTDTRKEVARVPCEQEILRAKVADSELRSVVRPDGVRVLQSVRIKGEQVAHRLLE